MSDDTGYGGAGTVRATPTSFLQLFLDATSNDTTLGREDHDDGPPSLR